MGKVYTRNAVLIDEAQAELRVVQADHVFQVRERERLLQQVLLLESSVAKDDSLTALVHRMMLRAVACPGIEAKQQAAAPPPLQLLDLPLSLLGYHNELLQRAANMPLDNCIQIYEAFVERALRAVSHIQCHGDQSYEKQQLTETVARFSNLLLLHGFLQLPVQRKYFTLNFMTLQEEEAPPGWYARIARLIPIHRNFAGLVQAGISCLQKSVDKKVQPGQGGDVLQQLQQLLQLQGAAVSDGLNMDALEHLVEACGRSATSVLLLRTMVSTYIFAGSLRFFDAVVVAQTLSSCWPYSPRGMVVYEEYCRRDDVQAVLQQQPQDAQAPGAASTASPAGQAPQQQKAAQQQQQQQQRQRTR